jgi:hypothetical protein
VSHHLPSSLHRSQSTLSPDEARRAGQSSSRPPVSATTIVSYFHLPPSPSSASPDLPPPYPTGLGQLRCPGAAVEALSAGPPPSEHHRNISTLLPDSLLGEPTRNCSPILFRELWRTPNTIPTMQSITVASLVSPAGHLHWATTSTPVSRPSPSLVTLGAS